jgi:hypothetical protein
MKPGGLALFLLFLAQVAVSQEEESYKTIFKSNRNPRVSGFGGLINEISGLDGNVTHQIGAEGAVLLNQSIFIGLYGQGMTTLPLYDITYYDESIDLNVNEKMRVAFGHGGVLVGGILRPNNAVHFGGSVRLGFGAYSLIPDVLRGNNPGNDPDYYLRFNDFVFLATPQIEAGINISSWFRINTGIGYRFVAGVDNKYYVQEGGFVLVERPFFESDAFNSPTFQIRLLFGGFR